nr:ribosomal protein L10 [Apopellia endiviifolia]WIA66324.1 ribosomal protein L10 [Apopellia endiviifolia]WIA66365.1 ribosomal protein L10 [Apopellia endiviifolia]WIA66406.1 ribosomal protein L10 [Apopellia endiviifolia]WKW95127.1 ribosomal protein L10 [Apopellia endiviifolia]
MQFLRKKALSLSALRAHQENHILLFHCSGLTSRQWRQIKNILCTIKGKTLFKPNLEKKNLKKNGPTCILYLTETPNTLITLPWRSPAYSQNLVLLYGQNGSLVFNHMDMEKATTLSIETSVFQQLLGFMFLPGACFLFLVEQIRGN